MIAASRGYGCTTVIPEAASIERVALSLALGSKVLTHKLKCFFSFNSLSLNSKTFYTGRPLTFNKNSWVWKVSSTVKGYYGITM